MTMPFPFNIAYIVVHLLVVCGIVVIVCGAVSLHFMKGTGPLIGENYVSAPIALIVIGVAVFLLAFLGCCGASQESYCMLTMFSTLLFLLLCAEITVGVLAFVYRGKAKEITEQQLRASMRDYYKRGEVNPAKQAWDFVQKQLECCGVTSSTDWVNLEQPASIPESCGANPSARPGCMEMLVQKVEKFSVYVGIAGFVIGAIELIGICFACCLANGVKS
ncbi:CD63 antigen-like isoform X2 [Varroa destructor]|uniref:Tetraspanin n=1 Tax=Varroa destructor TaxID=109461 RepID=A0A7M7K721_VARDE|nr:CD63 antigen-like isoform X2 [Varroa destructor]